MNDLITNNYSSVKTHTPLSRSLILWFLVLSLLPLSIVSWINYQQANNSLTKAAAESLKQSSNLSVSFIQSWFEYRLLELNNQAESQDNAELLATLIEGFKKSGKTLSKYVKSYDWVRRVDHVQNNLINLSRRYDYIYDLFLIDTEGNLLFSVAHESDLGTNLLDGRYAKTLFASSVKKTQQTGKVVFSDLERYAPSNNIIAGFITAPLLDEFGGKLGVFAIQIRIGKVFDSLKKGLKRKSSLTHYLIGEDRKLRSPISTETQEVLNRVINTEYLKYEANEHEHLNETAVSYTGPNGKSVIGLHQALTLPGVNWILVSEIDQDEALASVSWLARITLILVFITIVIVIILAIYLARRITRPIISLLNASMSVAAGEVNQNVKVENNNEIGRLAEAFNHMLHMRNIHEQDLLDSSAQAHLALAELAEQKYALDQHAIVAITDVEGNITFVNNKFCETSGYTREEMIGKNHRILNSNYHDAVFFKNMYDTITRGDVWHADVCNKAKDGHLYWVETTIVPFMGKNRKPKSYIAIRTDISEQKKSELELIKAKEDAEAATQQKSDFLANMSHEIRTPMNGIIGMTGLLLDTELDARQRDYADKTMSSADALLSIINDILDFSKIEAGKMELELLPFNLQTLMEDVSELMAMKCREKGVEMLLRFKPGTEKNVIGDPGRVRQILLNLLSNAIKFTEKGNVLLTVSSEIIFEGKANFSVSVADSGIGIDDDKLEKIFNKFDQEDGSTTRKYGGTGLGLAICRQLCCLMGGDINVESHKGHGSVFSFTMQLPLIDEDEIPSVQFSDVDKLEGLKVLLVDDLAISLTILSEQLSSLKLNIENALSGQMALDKLEEAIKSEEPFDIVITDFHMPEMDGEMLAVKIKEQKLLETGVLLFVTSSPRKGDGSRLKKLGFDGYLTKPTRALEIPQIISLICKAKQEGKDIPLVTRHFVREVRVGHKQKLKLKNTHILLAEDNPVNQMVATEYLERYGCSVSPAGNGLEAVSQLKNSNFDLILMDCQMPEMDGYEATIEIRKWENKKNIVKTPVIAFTANAMQGDKDKCFTAGMDDYISKPVSVKALEDILKKWLPENVEMVEFVAEEGKVVKSDVAKISPYINDSSQLDLSVFNVLKEMFGDTFFDAVEKHSSSAKDNIRRIEDALDKNDADKLGQAAHSLKGASGQFGAMVLSELSKQMEQFGNTGEIDKAKEIISDLKVAREQVEKLMLKEL